MSPPKRTGPFKPDDDLPPLREFEYSKQEPPRFSGIRFTVVLILVAYAFLAVYLGIANYCRFKQALHLPTTNCTCY